MNWFSSLISEVNVEETFDDDPYYNEDEGRNNSCVLRVCVRICVCGFMFGCVVARVHTYGCAYVMCVCMDEREREREKERSAILTTAAFLKALLEKKCDFIQSSYADAFKTYELTWKIRLKSEEVL